MSLKQLAEKKARDHFSFDVMQTNPKLCTCFVKNMYNNLKGLVGFDTAHNLTNEILETLALSKLITDNVSSLFSAGAGSLIDEGCVTLVLNFDIVCKNIH